MPRLRSLRAHVVVAAPVLALACLACAPTETPPTNASPTPVAPAIAAPSRGGVIPASVEVRRDDEPDDSPYKFAAGADVTTVAVPIPGSSLVRGRSTVTVSAPLDRVRSEVLGFSHYPEFMPHYSKCRVLGRSPSGGRDVYMEVEALHGAITMWARLDVKKPVQRGDIEAIETAFLQGNVKDLAATWLLKRVDERRTELTLEIFLDPKLPLPSGIINHENIDGSAAGVLAMKARVEQRLARP